MSEMIKVFMLAYMAFVLVELAILTTYGFPFYELRYREEDRNVFLFICTVIVRPTLVAFACLRAIFHLLKMRLGLNGRGEAQ